VIICFRMNFSGSKIQLLTFILFQFIDLITVNADCDSDWWVYVDNNGSSYGYKIIKRDYDLNFFQVREFLKYFYLR
jgi:hypothetical protein